MPCVLSLDAAYRDLHAEGTRLAGGLTDLSQRATVYHHVFRDSGGNHVFPLIAAHGALWARGWFRFGFRLAKVLSAQFALQPERRRECWNELEAFANTLRDVNRRVCVDTYANYHFTARYGDHSDAVRFVEPELLEALNRVHAARRAEVELSDADKREVFRAHFLHEQEHVVGPSVITAAQGLHWPLVRAVAMKPVIGFAFLPRGQRLWFRNFADRDERISNGLKAFEVAAEAGWRNVERALKAYGILPDAFFHDAAACFQTLRMGVT